MVAAVQDVSGELTGIHRTFLRSDGTGKAKVDSPKKMLGRCVGGAVRLAFAAETLAVGEGIETALSIMQATQVPTWAALSTSGLAGLELPAIIEAVIIVADGDPPGIVAAGRAAARWHREGRTVRIAQAPAGRDANDLLLRGATA